MLQPSTQLSFPKLSLSFLKIFPSLCQGWKVTLRGQTWAHKFVCGSSCKAGYLFWRVSTVCACVGALFSALLFQPRPLPEAASLTTQGEKSERRGIFLFFTSVTKVGASCVSTHSLRSPFSRVSADRHVSVHAWGSCMDECAHAALDMQEKRYPNTLRMLNKHTMFMDITFPCPLCFKGIEFSYRVLSSQSSIYFIRAFFLFVRPINT